MGGAVHPNAQRALRQVLASVVERRPTVPRETIPMITYWMGQRVDTLSREELLGVVEYLGAQLERERQMAANERELRRLASGRLSGFIG